MARPLIAVIDDDPHTLRMLETLLSFEGYATLLWSDSTSAVDAVKQNQPMVVILDLMMKGDRNAGLRILEQLSTDSEACHIPVIIASGTSDVMRGNAVTIQRLASAVLTKPFPLGALLIAIEAALSDARVGLKRQTIPS